MQDTSNSIPRFGSSPGEGIGFPLQYSQTSLVAQMVENPSAMQKICVWSLGWEDPLEEGMATHSNILAWRILMDWGAWWLQPMGLQRVRQERVTKYRAAQVQWYFNSDDGNDS